MGRKTVVWTFQTTNKQSLTRGILDRAEKKKSKERKRILSDSSTKIPLEVFLIIRELAVTWIPVKKHQLTLMRKTLK